MSRHNVAAPHHWRGLTGGSLRRRASAAGFIWRCIASSAETTCMGQPFSEPSALEDHGDGPPRHAAFVSRQLEQIDGGRHHHHLLETRFRFKESAWSWQSQTH